MTLFSFVSASSHTFFKQTFNFGIILYLQRSCKDNTEASTVCTSRFISCDIIPLTWLWFIFQDWKTNIGNICELNRGLFFCFISFSINTHFPLIHINTLFHDPVQDSTLHLGILSPIHFWHVTVSPSLLAFHDLDSLKSIGQALCRLLFNLSSSGWYGLSGLWECTILITSYWGISLITREVDLHHLMQVVFARLFHYRVTIFFPFHKEKGNIFFCSQRLFCLVSLCTNIVLGKLFLGKIEDCNEGTTLEKVSVCHIQVPPGTLQHRSGSESTWGKPGHSRPELPPPLYSHWEDVVVVAGTLAGPSPSCGLQTSFLSPSPLKVVQSEVLIPRISKCLKLKWLCACLPPWFFLSLYFCLVTPYHSFISSVTFLNAVFNFYSFSNRKLYCLWELGEIDVFESCPTTPRTYSRGFTSWSKFIAWGLVVVHEFFSLNIFF